MLTDIDVKAIIEGVDFDTTPFIETADVIVQEHLATKISNADLLEKITLYLAAHFVALTAERGGLIRSSAMDAAETYADVFKGGFRSTRYGQQALALDYTSTLTAISMGNITARFRIV